jgi:hypothetical protein
MEKLAWCVPACAMIGFGISFLLQPALWLAEFRDDGVSPDNNLPPTLRKIRYIGVGFVIVGVVVLYAILFERPAVDPVLI